MRGPNHYPIRIGNDQYLWNNHGRSNRDRVTGSACLTFSLSKNNSDPDLQFRACIYHCMYQVCDDLSSEISFDPGYFLGGKGGGRELEITGGPHPLNPLLEVTREGLNRTPHSNSVVFRCRIKCEIVVKNVTTVL